MWIEMQHKANKDSFSAQAGKERGFFEVVSNYFKKLENASSRVFLEDLILVQDECWQRG